MLNNIEYVDQFLKNNQYLNSCLNGCTDCCYDYFYVSFPEFYLTLYALLKLPTNLDYYYKKAKHTYLFFEKNLGHELSRLLPDSGKLITSGISNFEDGEYTNFQLLPSCIMLNNERCSIYNYRPNTCRKYGTTITCEYISNKDYRDDPHVNYNLFPLIKNTQIIDQHSLLVKTHRYPLWFYYYYFLDPKFRKHVLINLKKMMTFDDWAFANKISKNTK